MQGDNILPASGGGESGGNTKIVYILYLGAIVFGLLALIGVIFAYVSRSGGAGWVNDHYRFQIRTFWIGLLYSAVGVVSTVFLVGWLMLLATLVWWIVRCAKGLQCASRSEPYPNIETWLW
ncbi:MAG: hypothetical protein OXF51_01640 [Alphaproteobacteria bacterium]|nr:hypothetical protein [Alphaproteobacteria bacterium]